MNWKKVLHSVICLLVVCSILLTMVPFKAWATAAVPAVPSGSLITIDPIELIMSLIIGLGVSTGAADEDFDYLVSACYQDLLEQQLIDEFGKINAFLMEGADFIFGVASSVIESVRSFLFDSGTLTLVSSGFSGLSQDYGCYFNLLPSLRLCEFPFWDYMRYAYENDLAVVVSVGGSQFQGFYFDEYGDLNVGVWENPYGSALAKYCSMYPLSDLTLIDSYDGGHVFPSETVARAHPDYSSISAYVIDWSANGSFFSSTSQYSFPFYGFYKKSGDEVFSSASSSYTFYTGYDAVGGSGGNFGRLEYKYYMTSFDSFDDDVLVTGGFTSGVIAHPDQSLEDGYSEWAANSITVPGSAVGVDEDEIVIFPFGYGTSLDDIRGLSQSDVWTGSNVSSNTNTNTGTSSDSIANVGAETFWEKLVAVITTPFEWLADTVMTGIKAIFVPSEDFISDKVDTLMAEFSFIEPVVTLVKAFFGGIDSTLQEPPVIYINLDDTRGSYDIGGKTPFIDMTWYAEYKPTVDKLLSAFLVAVFLWRLFRQLPGIVSGMPGDFVMDGLSQLHIELPSRKAGYEIQRIANRESIRKGPKK